MYTLLFFVSAELLCEHCADWCASAEALAVRSEYFCKQSQIACVLLVASM